MEQVDTLDQSRDQMVVDIFNQAIQFHDRLKSFRNFIFDKVTEHVTAAHEKHKVKPGGKKGNITFYDYSGRYRISVRVSELIVFDERLQVAKSAIDDWMNNRMKGIDEDLKILIQDAFQVDKEGNVSVFRILGLRRAPIKDPAWLKAMEIISDAIQVLSTKRYVNIYRRAENGRWDPITLSIASV